MAQSSAMNSVEKSTDLDVKEDREDIKKEDMVAVKPEPHECIVCVTHNLDTFNIFNTNTNASGISLHNFLSKFSNSAFAESQTCPKFICKSCIDLINVLEQAELEYIKLKETFEAIISKNPLFDSSLHPISLESVKNEAMRDLPDDSFDVFDDLDSEDEPLAITKKKRHGKVDKRKKKIPGPAAKRKTRAKQNDESWECAECFARGTTGGSAAAAAHKLAVHSLEQSNTVLRDMKKEDTDGSQNGFENILKIEFDDINDNDDSSNFMPDIEPSSEENHSKRKVIVGRCLKTKGAQRKPKKKEAKTLHQCDECDAKYSSLARLKQHKQKHDGSKPPYICEVCGAHYKHKRACDIHIALHKGISDWKCEECNKLFPSKGALQRHNNIHTGKLNYQCDLCGKSFIHTSSFKMHKLSHSGVKPHACDVCGLALMTRSHLKRHKRVHSGEKRHECALCGKRFSERYNLAAHLRSHDHAPPPPLPRRRLFRCGFCPDRFERRYMLERHTTVVHGRALERPPPTPRNTMSKLLKAQAQAARPTHAASPARTPDGDSKDVRNTESRNTSAASQKLLAQLTASSSTSMSASSTWSGAYAEFNLRGEFPQ
ncbi:zinc finger protein 37-like [Achroia grisella]|uniref:zinc finger protein 37-like n=1 Tax=Achroia grisella TaxID=688607 RepID=UPI0027D32600|nr:zinc finger protein 37-like [Achroia grisella]